jgi:hypothetical protein
MDLGHDDQALRKLLAPLDRIEPLPATLSRPRSRRPILVVGALFVGVLAIAGVAIGSSVIPFAGLGSADRPAQSNDSIGPAVATQLQGDELPGNPLDQVGVHRVDSARLIGSLPSGRNVYVVATTKDKLCVVVARLAESCGDPISSESPITFTTFSRGDPSGDPPVAYGVARDDVVSVSFSINGRAVTVPVHDNFFVYEGLASDGIGHFSAVTVTLASGKTESVQ